MRFHISRTSMYEGQPCEEASLQEFENWHIRTCTEEEFNHRFSEREGLWRSKGKNHHITDEGYIARQEDSRKLWAVEIATLDDLVSFMGKYGKLIISYDESLRTLTIEIYDDYRE